MIPVVDKFYQEFFDELFKRNHENIIPHLELTNSKLINKYAPAYEIYDEVKSKYVNEFEQAQAKDLEPIQIEELEKDFNKFLEQK
jgi:hypothetical protein